MAPADTQNFLDDDASSFTESVLTASSSSTVLGPGAITGRFLKAVGGKSLDLVVSVVIRRRLAVIKQTLRKKPNLLRYPQNAEEWKQTKDIYDHLKELCWYEYYSPSLRRTAAVLIRDITLVTRAVPDPAFIDASPTNSQWEALLARVQGRGGLLSQREQAAISTNRQNFRGYQEDLDKRDAWSQTWGSIPTSPSMSMLDEHPSDDDGISMPWNFQHHVHVDEDLHGIPPSWASDFLDTKVEHPSDDGISMPWNFQHHVHVDDDLHGMPPSWTSALMEAGFSKGEIVAFYKPRQTAMLPSDDPPEFMSTGTGSPQLTLSARSSSAGTVTPGNHTLRSASLRGPILGPSASSPATAFSGTPRPPSPASSSEPSRPATGPRIDTRSLTYSHSRSYSSPRSPHSPQSPEINSPSPSLSHSSPQSSPLAPLSLRSFHVVDEDPDPTPTPAPPSLPYAASTPIFAHAGLQSSEKSPLPELDVGKGASKATEQGEAQVEVWEVLEEMMMEEPLREIEVEEEVTEIDKAEENDDSGLATPPSPLPHVPRLPPRLSLHSDQDDEWGDMFRFLPSSRGPVAAT